MYFTITISKRNAVSYSVIQGRVRFATSQWPYPTKKPKNIRFDRLQIKALDHTEGCMDGCSQNTTASQKLLVDGKSTSHRRVKRAEWAEGSTQFYLTDDIKGVSVWHFTDVASISLWLLQHNCQNNIVALLVSHIPLFCMVIKTDIQILFVQSNK